MNWTILFSVLFVGDAAFYLLFGVYNKNQLHLYRCRKRSELEEKIRELAVPVQEVEFLPRIIPITG